MTALAALVTLCGFALAGRMAVRLRSVDRLARRLVAESMNGQVQRATRLGLVNPPPPRRWSQDRKPEPVHRVLHDMPSRF